jgi:hypothetical protein
VNPAKRIPVTGVTPAFPETYSTGRAIRRQLFDLSNRKDENDGELQ